MSYSSATLGQPPSDARLPEQVRERALLPLVAVLADMLSGFDQALLEHALHAPSSLQQSFLGAARDLQGRREEIVARFRNQLTRSWDALRDGRPQSIDDVLAAPASESLSLVSDQELDSRLAVLDLAASIRRECKEQLSQLDRRVGRLMSQYSLESGQNPIGPEHVGAAAFGAFHACNFPPEVRIQLLVLCEARLSTSLGRVYASLNEWMAQVGVKPAAPSAPNRGMEAQAVAAAESVDSAESAEAAAPPAWVNRFLSRMSGSLPGAGQLPLHTQLQGNPMAGLPMQALAGLDPAALEHGDAPGVQTVLLEALHYMLHNSRQTRAAPEVFGAAPGNVQRDMSQREVLSVLSLLQATPEAAAIVAATDNGEPLTQRLKREMFSGATQLGVDPSSVRLSPADEDAIDLVGMLFDVMLDERDLDGRSRELLGRLVVPFVKVAMIDRRMFVQKTHPARRLLNALAEACEGNDGVRPAARTLLAKVEEVVGRLLAEFNESVAIFKVLEEEFRTYLEQYRRSIEVAERRAAEAQRGQERLESARLRTQVELQVRLLDEQLPQAFKDFLSRPWAHHVTLAVLREGDGGEGLGNALAVADALLEELSEARRHVTGKNWLQWQRPGLQLVFASVGMTEQAAEQAINALVDTLKSIAEARPELEKALPELPKVELGKPVAPAPSPALEVVGGTDTLDFDQRDASYFRHLPEGAWVDFIDKDNKVQTCKLSWVSPISSRLLFVNRRGLHYCVASPEELAAMVRLGRLRPNRSEGAFDSAMQGVIERLEPNVALGVPGAGAAD